MLYIDVEQAMEYLLVLLDRQLVNVEVHRQVEDLEMYADFSEDDDMEVYNQVGLDMSYDREQHPMTKHQPWMYALLHDIVEHLLLQVRNITMFHYCQFYK